MNASIGAPPAFTTRIEVPPRMDHGAWGVPVTTTQFAARLVSCPSHNVISSDPSDNQETESDGLALTEEQRSELGKWAASRTLPAGDVFRARLILGLADGWTYSRIMTSPQTTAPTISRWKQRFEKDGLAGLDPRHKGSQPRVANASVQARIARRTQQKPADGSTHSPVARWRKCWR
jgi:hypothetical protein